MKKRLLVVGGRGSGEIAMSVFEDVNEISNEWVLEGFLTDIKKKGDYLGKHKVIGSTEEIEDYVRKGYYIHYTLHFNAKKKYERVMKFKSLKIPLEANASAIHPKAYINPSTKTGNGVVICPNAATSFGPEIGNFVHLYTNCLVGHDTFISDYCTLTAHSVLGARLRVKEGAHIGLNSCLREDLTIGKYSIIGMGAVVIKDVDDFSIVAGNPAKEIKK